MAGTQLQEIGHDAVIVAFIHKVLTALHDRAIYLVNPAIGPKRDIYFCDGDDERFISAYSVSNGEYIPAFQYRFQIPPMEMAELETSSRYRQLAWYVHLSSVIGKDVVAHFTEICDTLEARLESDLPDVIAVDLSGDLVGFAEVKFEGFSLKARDAVLVEYRVAKELGIDYHLAIPKHPSYSRELTDTWLRRNLPADLNVFKFEIPKEVVLPKQSQIQFFPVQQPLLSADH